MIFQTILSNDFSDELFCKSVEKLLFIVLLNESISVLYLWEMLQIGRLRHRDKL